MIRNRFVTPPVVQTVALLVLAFVVGPARSAEPADVKSDDAKRMIELLDKIERRLATQEAQSQTTLDLVKLDIKGLQEEVGRLRKEVAELRRTQSGTTTSNYPPSSPAVSAFVAPMAQGRVRIVNNYLMDMAAVVNGTSVSVPPGRYLDVLVPAGTVTYQIPMLPQSTKTTSVAANESLTLTLFPM
jgi:hypothetical protein